jgi:hypothetical protein
MTHLRWPHFGLFAISFPFFEGCLILPLALTYGWLLARSRPRNSKALVLRRCWAWQLGCHRFYSAEPADAQIALMEIVLQNWCFVHHFQPEISLSGLLMESGFDCFDEYLEITDWSWCTRFYTCLRTSPAPSWVWDYCLGVGWVPQFVFLFTGFAPGQQHPLRAAEAVESHVTQGISGSLPKNDHVIEHDDFIYWEHSHPNFWNAIDVIGAQYLPRFIFLEVFGPLWRCFNYFRCCPSFSGSSLRGSTGKLYYISSTAFSSSSPSLHILLFQFGPFWPFAGWYFPFAYKLPR